MLNAQLKRCLASKDENSYVNKRFLSNTALPSWCIFHDTRLISVQHFLSDRNGAWDTTNNSKWRLAGNAATTSGLRLGRSEVWRRLRHYLRAQSQGHHPIDRLEERGVERGSARRSSLRGRERAIVNRTNIGTVSKATLGKRLRDGVDRLWAFPSA